MTPNNIVNMAILKGLDVIAITDHNSAKNIDACIKAAKDKILVIPGMEIESREEVHLLCLFEDLNSALMMEKTVDENTAYIKNREDIFGRQEILDEFDNLIGTHDKLLLKSCDLSVYEIKKETERLGGVCIPAHIDRESFSIISNLGFITEDMGFTTLEISNNTTREEFLGKNEYLKNYSFIQNSDAHALGYINERVNAIEVYDKTLKSVISALKLRQNP